MTNLEFYKDEIINKIKNENRSFECLCREFKYKNRECVGISCISCRLEIIDWILENHEEQIPLKQWEYDVLKAVKSHNQSAYRFNESSILKQLVNKGHFKNVDDTRNEIKHAIIQDVLDNCKIVADDYDFGGNEE